MFIASLFTIVRTWKQPRCPLTDGGIKKMCYRYIMEYDSAIPLLGIYPEETKIEKDTCAPTVFAALFTVGRTWKQPRCPLTDEWIKNRWYRYTMEYYSTIKTDAFESVLMK